MIDLNYKENDWHLKVDLKLFFFIIVDFTHIIRMCPKCFHFLIFEIYYMQKHPNEKLNYTSIVKIAAEPLDHKNWIVFKRIKKKTAFVQNMHWNSQANAAFCSIQWFETQAFQTTKLQIWFIFVKEESFSVPFKRVQGAQYTLKQ